jgi:ABC-type glutathione transport system ATPase component
MQVACPAEQQSAAAVPSRAHALMSVRGLGIRFRTSQGVWQATRGIDVDVARCERVGIVGESGCGNSITGLSILWLLPTNLVWTARSWSMASILPRVAPRQCAMYAPGLAILVVSPAFNAVGESLRIVFDPTMKDR